MHVAASVTLPSQKLTNGVPAASTACGTTGGRARCLAACTTHSAGAGSGRSPPTQRPALPPPAQSRRRHAAPGAAIPAHPGPPTSRLGRCGGSSRAGPGCLRRTTHARASEGRASRRSSGRGRARGSRAGTQRARRAGCPQSRHGTAHPLPLHIPGCQPGTAQPGGSAPACCSHRTQAALYLIGSKRDTGGKPGGARVGWVRLSGGGGAGSAELGESEGQGNLEDTSHKWGRRPSGVEQAQGEHTLQDWHRQRGAQAVLRACKAQRRGAQAGGGSGR